MTSEQQAALDAEAQRRVRVALRQIEDAQNKLGDACATLSSLIGAIPHWQATSKLHDRVHAHWYKVQQALQGNGKIKLDGVNAEKFLQRPTDA